MAEEVQKLHQQLHFQHWLLERLWPDDPIREASVLAHRLRESRMQPLIRGLLWPVISLVVIGATHLMAELVKPELHDVIGPGVAMPIYLVAGVWAGFTTIRAGGSAAHGFTAAAILGLLPMALQLFGFGLIAGRPAEVVTTAGAFGWLGVFWGGSLGSGIASARVGLGGSSTREP